MNLDSSKTNRSIEIDGEATDTFSFDVSAAQAAELKQKSEDDSEIRQAKPTKPQPAHHDATAKDTNTVDRSGENSNADNFPVIRIDRRIKQKPRVPSWVASVILHAALLVPFGFLTQSQQLPTNDESLQVSFEPIESLEDVHLVDDLEIELQDELEDVEVDLPDHLPETEIAELPAEPALELLTTDPQFQPTSLDDIDSLFNAGTSNDASLGEELGNSPMADFFGTKVAGNRIVYVLDNSGGMVTGELETLVAELMRSVDSLSNKQYFYIIFYSDSLYPLFYPNAPQHFVRATDKNKRLLEQWLDTVELCVGNVVDEAVAAATAIRPDAVYLLTDGDLDTTRDQRRIRFLLDSSARSFPIHTFGLGTGKQSKAAAKLKQVADANNGSFRAVEIEPDAVALAKIKNRPYHNKSPGAVWGLRVGQR